MLKMLAIKICKKKLQNIYEQKFQSELFVKRKKANQLTCRVTQGRNLHREFRAVALNIFSWSSLLLRNCTSVKEDSSVVLLYLQ